MIDGQNFRIIEDEDILKACNFLEDAAIGMLKEQEKDHDEHDQYILDFVSNIFTTIAAAGVGAAVARTQGGLVIINEKATEEDRKAAAEALRERRQKLNNAERPGGGIQQ
jgi:hypothetical protein